MIRFLLITIIFLPSVVFAYTSVVMNPVSVFEKIPVVHPEQSQEFFGTLRDFPQTYEFVVKETFDFNARVSVPDTKTQQNDVAIILVKEETRGVSEIDRTHKKEYAWDTHRDGVLAEKFRIGGAITATLEPGIYRLEVSSPNNSGTYRLVLGSDSFGYGYFENIRRVAEVQSFLGTTRLGMLFSPLIYWPILLLLGVFVGYRFYKKKYA